MFAIGSGLNTDQDGGRQSIRVRIILDRGAGQASVGVRIIGIAA